MNRDAAINVIAAARGDAAIVVGPGLNSSLMYMRADSPASLYNMDMAYTVPVALGIALAKPNRRVLAIEGDGSFYAGSTVLSTIWRLQPVNLTIIVLDNGIWSTGDAKEPTATAFGANLAQIARGAGWSEDQVAEVHDQSAFQTYLSEALRRTVPTFIVAKTDPAQDQFLIPDVRVILKKPRHQLDCVVLTSLALAEKA